MGTKKGQVRKTARRAYTKHTKADAQKAAKQLNSAGRKIAFIKKRTPKKGRPYWNVLSVKRKVGGKKRKYSR